MEKEVETARNDAKRVKSELAESFTKLREKDLTITELRSKIATSEADRVKAAGDAVNLRAELRALREKLEAAQSAAAAAAAAAPAPAPASPPATVAGPAGLAATYAKLMALVSSDVVNPPDDTLEPARFATVLTMGLLAAKSRKRAEFAAEVGNRSPQFIAKVQECLRRAGKYTETYDVDGVPCVLVAFSPPSPAQ